MNPIAIGAIALGAAGVAYETHKNTTPPSPAVTAKVASGSAALDPSMDHWTAAVVGAALQKETDPTILTAFAQNLKDAGYTQSAAAISAKAKQLGNNASA